MSSNQSYTEPPSTAQPPSLPTCVDELPWWCVWRLEERDDKPTKVPYSPVTGQRAESNNPTTFGTRAQAEEVFAPGRYTGLGFLVHESLDVTVVDLDKVIERPGDDLPPEVWELITAADTYVEWSPSRTGLHLIFAGGLGNYRNTNGGRAICRAEAYTRARFMTFTGDHLLGTPEAFNDNAADLVTVLERLGFEKRTRRQQARRTEAHWHADDKQLLAYALRAKNGPKLERLLAGDITGYPESQSDKGFSSEADLALMGILSFWTQDREQLTRIWRSSKLYRAKLDRDDYIDRTIERALEDGETYDPHYGAPADVGTGTVTTSVVLLDQRQDTMGDRQEGRQEGRQDATVGVDSLKAEIRRLTAELEAARETITIREGVIARERELRKAAEARLTTLSTQRTRAMWVLRNPDLSAGERLTGFALALDLHARVANGEEPAQFGYNVPSIRLAEMTGQSEQAVARHLREFDKRGVITKRVVREAVQRDHVDADGVIETEIGARDRNYIEVDNIIDLTERLAGYKRPEDAPKHGGTRHPRCSEHPDAGTVKEWVVRCADSSCRKVLDTGVTCQAPVADAGEGSGINLIPDTPRVSDPSLSDTKLIPEDAPSEPLWRETCEQCGDPIETGRRRCHRCAETEHNIAEATRRTEQARRVKIAGTRACVECGEPTPDSRHRYCTAHGGGAAAGVAS